MFESLNNKSAKNMEDEFSGSHDRRKPGSLGCRKVWIAKIAEKSGLSRSQETGLSRSKRQVCRGRR